jgi:hypothetical protein
VNGTFFTVQFQVKKTAPPGASGLNLMNVSLKDTPTTSLARTVTNGQVNVIGGCAGDLNGDGLINFNDFVIFAAAYGTSSGNPGYNPLADLNHDGKIDFSDFTMFAAVYGTSCSG